jgi:hypothetical protein
MIPFLHLIERCSEHMEEREAKQGHCTMHEGAMDALVPQAQQTCYVCVQCHDLYECSRMIGDCADC